jgi:plastocyanin
MADLRFEPRELTVARGTTVTFRNVGKVTHNAKGKTFFSRVVEAGGSYRHRFDQAGTFEYLCTFHPGMEGTLTVR